MSQQSLQNFEQSIPKTILQRGQEYFRNGNVEYLEEVAPGVWEAMVEGSSGKDYAIDIQFGAAEKIVDYDCTCHFDGDSMCKHIVAVLLKIRSRRHPATPPGRLNRADMVQQARELLLARRLGKNAEIAS